MPLNIKQCKIADLIFAEYNPRQLTADEHRGLKDSLTRFGFVDPVIVNTHPDRKNIVIGGHQRIRIWQEMGNDTAPCVELHLPPARERELNIRLNRNVGSWDWDALGNHFDKDELLEWGFKDWEFGETDGGGDPGASESSPSPVTCPECGHEFVPAKAVSVKVSARV